MSAGIPLTDDDRWDWLATLSNECVSRLDTAIDVVVACSALKKSYRNVVRAAAAAAAAPQPTSSPSRPSPAVRVRFVYLHAPEDVVTQRALARQGHYMAAGMVRSQYSILEPPAEDERDDVLWVDATGPLDEVERDVVAKATATRRAWVI